MPRPLPKPDLVAFGHQVAKLRQERGWSLDLLSDRAGISRDTLINTEQAKKVARLTTVWALAQALEVPLADLVQALGGQRST